MKKSRVVFSLLLALMLMISISGIVLAEGASSTENNGQNGTTLTAYITMTPHWTSTFQWTIDKSVTPSVLNMFRGDSGSVEYTVQVNKSEPTDHVWFDGEVCVKNGGSVDTEGLAISVDIKTPPGDKGVVVATTQVDVSSAPVIGIGDTKCYDYSVDLSNPDFNATYKATAHITITNHSGSLGTPFGPSPSATTSLPSAPVLINDSIHVDDTNGDSWAFSDTGSVSYSKTFTCDADEGAHGNTATIRETAQADSASVQVNCYALTVTKDASTSFTRTYNWHIAKSVNPPSLTLALNQSYVVNYSIVVGITDYTDSDWAVSGAIHVHNPAPIAAPLTGVSDAISGVGSASVDCGVTFPYSLAAGGTLDCTYTSPLPDATTRTNTATATLQNTPSGTTGFTGSASVDFTSAAMTEQDTCVDVGDSYTGYLGTVCKAIAPKTFTYSRQIGPYEVCGEYKVNNTADFVTVDLGRTGFSSATVDVNVPCPGGCTLTIGYWKNHAGFGPQADMVSTLLQQTLGSITVDTPGKAVQFLSFFGSNNYFNASNPVNKLYAQLLGAKLNIADGASSSAISTTLNASDDFLMTHNSLTSLTKQEKSMVLTWATILDNFNNGLIGPGHCSQ